MDQDDGRGTGDKWLNSRFMLKVKPTGFSDGMSAGYEKRGCFLFSKALERMKWPLTEVGKTRGGAGLGDDVYT